MNITGHVFDNENSDVSDYEIEHDGSIQSETSRGKDGNIDEREVEEHQNVQHVRLPTSTHPTTTADEE